MCKRGRLTSLSLPCCCDQSSRALVGALQLLHTREGRARTKRLKHILYSNVDSLKQILECESHWTRYGYTLCLYNPPTRAQGLTPLAPRPYGRSVHGLRSSNTSTARARPPARPRGIRTWVGTGCRVAAARSATVSSKKGTRKKQHRYLVPVNKRSERALK